MPITKDEAKNMGLKIVGLSNNEEEILLEKIYMQFHRMSKKAEDALLPILSVLPVPIISAKKIETRFGLIYLPPIDLLDLEV